MLCKLSWSFKSALGEQDWAVDSMSCARQSACTALWHGTWPWAPPTASSLVHVTYICVYDVMHYIIEFNLYHNNVTYKRNSYTDS